MSRRWLLPVVAAIGAGLLLWRGRAGSGEGDAARFGGPAQGTTYRVVLGGPRPAATVAALQRAVDSLLADVDAAMSTYDSRSELARINRDRSGRAHPLSPALAEVLRDAVGVSRASGGAFDVTVGPLVDAWGFGVDGTLTRAPDDTMLAGLRERVGWDKLRLAGDTLAKGHPALEIDLSAIAPGHTVDRISDLLVARGEPNHLVELGGELRARGRTADGRPFRVGIEEPDPASRRVRLVVGLSDRALATSGNYRDFHDVDGVRYVHTIDPATGRPVTHRLLSVSVLHDRCALADAWATALLVVGPERARALAEANGLDVLLLVAGEGGEVVEWTTPGFARVRLADGR